MRLIITTFILFFCTPIFCQVNLSPPKIDSLENLISEIYSNQNQPSDSIKTPKPDIKSLHWNTKEYNPFKKVTVSYPFKLVFEDSSFASPIHKDKVITSRFGRRRGGVHKGIDIDLITGDSLFALLDGIVRFAKYSPGHGKTVIVRHYNGLETVYAHLYKYGVKANDTVTKGEYIGKGGATGNARGSHLHLEVNYQGKSIHPEYLLNFDDNKIRSQHIWITTKWTRPYLHNSRRKSNINALLSEEEAIASMIKTRSIYTVKAGDTLSHISARKNVSIASLCKTNSLKRNAIIKVGQRLIIEN